MHPKQSNYISRPILECHNTILNAKLGYSNSERMSKQNLECQNTIFRFNAIVKKNCENVKIEFSDSVRVSERDFECQNRIVDQMRISK